MEDKQEEQVVEKFRLRTIISDTDVSDLRKPSDEVEFLEDADGNRQLDNETKEVIQALKDFVVKNDGLGMAAVQLGVHKRIFVMRKPFNTNRLLVVINPEIKRGQGRAVGSEGCFSVPDLPGLPTVARKTLIHVDYIDDQMNFHEEEMLIGMDARIFQHEQAHLDGELFIDDGRYGTFRGWKPSF